MSWRVIFAFLLLAAAASAWGGLQLGEWLVAHGPEQVPTTQELHPELNSAQVLDAEGRPFVATAPQPLPDGRQGVPQLAPPVDWTLQGDSLMDEPGDIALATTTISLDEAIALAQQGMLDGTDSAAGMQLDPNRIQPIDITVPDAPPPASAAQPTETNWQARFQAELRACANLGFFSRPSCAWAARNKYCEPNKAWGIVDGCPSKRSEL